MKKVNMSNNSNHYQQHHHQQLQQHNNYHHNQQQHNLYNSGMDGGTTTGVVPGVTPGAVNTGGHYHNQHFNMNGDQQQQHHHHHHNNSNHHHHTTGSLRLSNGYNLKPLENIAVPDMCIFCFEVLDCELNNLEGPCAPKFTNDAQ